MSRAHNRRVKASARSWALRDDWWRERRRPQGASCGPTVLVKGWEAPGQEKPRAHRGEGRALWRTRHPEPSPRWPSTAHR